MNKTYVKDLAERVLWTFLAGFFGAVSLDIVDITTLGWAGWFVSGVGAGVVSLLKGLAAKAIGHANSASTVPSVGNSELPPPRPNVTGTHEDGSW